MKSRRDRPEPETLRDARYKLRSAIIRGVPAEEIERLREAVKTEERKLGHSQP